MKKLIVIAALFVAGCASQIMQGFVGQPLQAVMVEYGPPINAFDMPDGRRAFQWSRTSSFTMPVQATNTGAAIPIGNTVWWTQNTQITGGQTFSSECTYTLFARWSDESNAWIVEGFQRPRYMCE